MRLAQPSHIHGSAKPLAKPSKAKGSGTKAFRTPSGSVSANARRSAAAKGQAMPGGKRSIGRAKHPAAARAFINKRAKSLGQPPVGG